MHTNLIDIYAVYEVHRGTAFYYTRTLFPSKSRSAESGICVNYFYVSKDKYAIIKGNGQIF